MDYTSAPGDSGELGEGSYKPWDGNLDIFIGGDKEDKASVSICFAIQVLPTSVPQNVEFLSFFFPSEEFEILMPHSIRRRLAGK